MEVDILVRGSATLRLRAAQGHARAGGTRHQATVRIGYVALDQSDRASTLNAVGRGRQASLPDRAEEIDFQLERGERLAVFERAGVSKAHRGVGQVAQDAAVDGAHRIGVLFQVGVELEYRPTWRRGERTEA